MANKPVENIEQRKKKASRILSTISNLPTIPYVIFEVTKLIERPDSSASQLAKIINQDQGLVTKVLSVANSPLYGIPRRVSTIEFAIVILGFNHIKNIVIALSMMDALKNIGDKRFIQREYWLHSIITAYASKKIADDLGYHTSGEAFTAGLLHDLGLPIINKYFTKEFQVIMDSVEKDEQTFLEAEMSELGITHGEIGKSLMDKWNLPQTLSEVVLYHHIPSEAENNQTLTSIVHLADYMTHKLQIGNFLLDGNYKLDEKIFDILKIGDEEYLESFVESYRELFENQLESLQF